MKIFSIIFSIIAIAIVATFGWIAIYFASNKQRVIDNIKFIFKIENIFWPPFASILSANVNIQTRIENRNPIFIIFSHLYVRLFYNNELIAQSKDVDIATRFIPVNGELTFNHEMVVNVNIFKIKQPIKIDYEIDVHVFGFKIETIKSSYTV